MAKRKRRAFTEEFKTETVRLIRESGKSIAVVARELGLTESAVRAWVRQGEIDAGHAPAGAPDARGAGGARPLAARGANVADGARHPKKSDGLLRQGERVRYAFIREKQVAFPVAMMCRVLAALDERLLRLA